MGGVNDGAEQARQLTRLLRDIPCKINLIPFNPFPGTRFRSPDPKKVDQFKEICMAGGYICTVRKTRGDDIAAACGQLAGNFMDRTRRSATYGAESNKWPLEVR
jgi:23S rRNA m(2)A-2503 methyltransferase (EC 2.1.1.-)